MNYKERNLQVFKENLYMEIDNRQIKLATRPEIEMLASIVADNVAFQVKTKIAGDDLGRVEWKVPKTWWEHIKMAFYRSKIGLWFAKNSVLFYKLKQKTPVKYFTHVFDIKSYYPLIPINGNRPNIIVARMDSMFDWKLETGAFPTTDDYAMEYQEYIICPRCKGTGYLVSYYPDPMNNDDRCEICDGLGSVPTRKHREPYEVSASDNRKDNK